MVLRARVAHDLAGLAPLEGDHAAQEIGRGPGARRRDREGVARLARLAGRADLDEARVGAGEVVPARVVGVEELDLEAHEHDLGLVAVAGHRPADADRVGMADRVADVDRRPQALVVQDRVGLARGGAGRSHGHEQGDRAERCAQRGHTLTIPSAPRGFRCSVTNPLGAVAPMWSTR